MKCEWGKSNPSHRGMNFFKHKQVAQKGFGDRENNLLNSLASMLYSQCIKYDI